MRLRLPNRSARAAYGAACACVLLFLAAAVEAPAAEESGPFAALSGSWSGSGTVSISNGSNERIRCRASYDVLDRATSVQLNLRCASDSYNFNLISLVKYASGGAISGSWTESTRNVAGSLSGRASRNQIEAMASGGSFSADLTLVTRGDHQSVAIRSTGAELTGAKVTLTRN